MSQCTAVLNLTPATSFGNNTFAGLGNRLLFETLSTHSTSILSDNNAAISSGTPLDDSAMTHSNDADSSAEPIFVRSIFISDLHLGTSGCQADALLSFLKHYESEYLYLVGDIIDGWQLKRRWYWPQAHNDVVQKVLRKVRKGTKVIFVPGNHDEFARKLVGLNFGGVEVKLEHTHTTADGKKIWITHGDLFDAVIQHARWMALIGDIAYVTALKVNTVINRLRVKVGLPYWSLSQYLKIRVKKAVSYIGDFEEAVVKEAKKRGVDAVLCGHIHHAQIRTIDGITYLNDGDWVESLTAITEDFDGKLAIVDYQPLWRNLAQSSTN